MEENLRTLVETQKNLAAFLEQMNSRLTQVEQRGVGRPGRSPSTGEECDVSDFEEEEAWPELQVDKMMPKNPNAVKLVTNLAVPPTADQVEKLRAGIVKYKGVPITPISTRKAEDRRLHDLQSMVEDTMHLGVQFGKMIDGMPNIAGR